MNNTPHAFLPYQQRWLADPAPVRVCEKSRRIGLSWATAAECVLTAARAEQPQHGWYIGYNEEMAKEFISDCASWAKQFNLAASAVNEELVKDEEKDIRTWHIHFATGKRVTALSSRPTNLRGKGGLVVLDEAAFHAELGELLKAAIALLIWGGRVAIISTHNGEDNPFNILLKDCRAGKFPYSVHRITFEEAVADGLYHRICLRTGRPWSAVTEAAWVTEIRRFYGENAGEELDCIPKGGGGTWLSRGVLDRAVAPCEVLRIARPAQFVDLPDEQREQDIADWCAGELATVLTALPHLPTSYGADFGRTTDLTVFWFLQQQLDLSLSSVIVLELRNIPFRQQEQILFFAVDRLQRFFAGAMDATGNGAFLAEVAAQRYGGCIAQVKLSQEWYREQAPRTKVRLEDGTLRLPADLDLMTDLRSMVVDKGVPRVGARYKGTDDEPRHGDGAVALMMAVYACDELVGGPMQVVTAGQRVINELEETWL